MSEIDSIRKIAQELYLASDFCGKTNSILWDRSQRLVRNVEFISGLDEVSRLDPDIDRFSLISSAYFCESGHINCKVGNGNGLFSHGNGKKTEVLENSTEVVSRNLGRIIEKSKVDKINKIIIESGTRFTQRVEAMVLSDARNLNDMGLIGVMNDFRRHFYDGKGISEAVTNWERKIDYQYWQARLKDGFRFESVRILARNRLSAAEVFMNQLRREHLSEDTIEI